MSALLSHRSELLEHGLDEAKRDEDLVFTALMQHPTALQYADWCLRYNKDVALAAVSQGGLALQYVKPQRFSSELQKKVILAALSQNGEALAWAMASNSDLEIVLTTMSENYSACKYTRDPS